MDIHLKFEKTSNALLERVISVFEPSDAELSFLTKALTYFPVNTKNILQDILEEQKMPDIAEMNRRLQEAEKEKWHDIASKEL